MTKTERAKFADLIRRQQVLVTLIKEYDVKPWEDMTETEQRRYDQWYGECIGIEAALEAFRIPFVSVDNR